MFSYEGLRLKISSVKRFLCKNILNNKLKNSNFTIISNNCWGGMVYESYGLKKQSPTVGLFFMAEDYVRFLCNFQEYIQCELEFINPFESKWVESPVINSDSRFGRYPIGRLTYKGKSIEIFFLHYSTKEEAKDKWTRRCKRINLENLIVKFNDQNECDKLLIEKFFNLPFENKIFFSAQDWESFEFKNEMPIGFIHIKQWPRSKCIRTSFEPLAESKYINLTSYINNMGKNMK